MADYHIIGDGALRASTRLVETRLQLVSQPGVQRTVKAYEVAGDLIVEGDIVIARSVPRVNESGAPPADVRSRGIVIHDRRRLWPQALVPFQIDSAITWADRIRDAMHMWEQRTPVRFRHAAGEQSYAVFRLGAGDNSEVAMTGGEQYVELAPGASVGSIVHEIGHLIGLWHEQSRHDRDQHVRIVWDNIDPDLHPQFDQHLQDGDDVGPYDYGSVMHYPKNAFAKDASRATIVTLHGEEIGQRDHISDGDAEAVARLYAGA